MDMDKIREQMAEDQKRREKELENDRAAMLKKLTKAGIKKVDGTYDGSGDSGNSEITKLDPETTLSKEDEESLRDLIWDTAYALNPGFENNEGGNGEFFWNIPDDKIQVCHVHIIEEYANYDL